MYFESSSSSTAAIFHNYRSMSAVKYEPPPWLQDVNANPPKKEQYTPISSQDTTSEITETHVSNEGAHIPRMILYTRVINLGLSICMILASLLSLLTTESATTGVLACYVTVFSCLLCCFETHLKQVSKVIATNFGFLYSAKSRAAFMIFVGSILFSFSLFGKVVGLLMLANAVFNIFIIVRYPGYEDAQRKDAQSEIASYLAANPAFAQQMIALGAGATASFAAKNPDVMKKAAEASLNAATVPPTPQYAEV